MSTLGRALRVAAIVLLLSSSSYGNWSETFDGGDFDLGTWQFLSYPALTGTYTHTVVPTDKGGYLAMGETSSVSKGGSAFGAAFGSDEVFADVRVGAVVNVAGDASHNHHGLCARMTYFMDDGTASGAPGVVASGYVMHINWENGPANLSIDVEKVVNLQNIMDEDFDVLVPRLDNARSYYAELEAVGAGPVYVTGRLYEYQGGPLVAQTATMVDTSGNDLWEDAGERDEPFLAGQSGIFAQNEQSEPAGFYTTFDDVSSVSDGPMAVAISPADGATDISVMPALRWVEGAFATGREVWFGPAGDMQLVDPAPQGAVYEPGMLDFDTAYEWRVDLIGPAGTVEGQTWRFTTGRSIPVEDFELYGATSEVAAAWVHNIGADFEYVFLETATVAQGDKAMRLHYQNQYEPFFTEATRTFETVQDWTVGGPVALEVAFRGESDNLEQRIYLRVEDSAGNQATIDQPFSFAPQTEFWRIWTIDVSEIAGAGVDLASVAKLTVGVGDGEVSDQQGDDSDTLYIDQIRLRLE